jgi:Flp pilus assembly protein TadD
MLVSACTLFRDSGNNGSVLTDQDTKNFLKSIRAREGNAESYYNLGCHFQERKKHKLAISEFYKALEYDPTYIQAYNALGVSYDALGDYDLATDSYNSALQIDPNSGHILNNLGYSYLLQNKPELAVESFKKAVTLNSDNDMYHNNLGLAYANMGEFEAAYAEFKKSGDEAKAHYNIAQLYYQKGLYKKAKEHFSAASLINDSEPETERALKASENLVNIIAKETKAIRNPSENPFNAPDVEIVYNDDEGVYTIPAGNLEKRQAKDEKEKAETVEHLTGISTVEVVMYDDDEGMYTIPVDAIKKSESGGTIKTALKKKAHDFPDKKGKERVVTAAMIKVETQEVGREGLETVLEENGLVIFNESYAPKMMKIKKTSLTNRPAPRIKIEVKNGNGLNRMARRVGEYLRNRDIILMYLSNADNFKHKYSKIYYASGFLQEAYQLSQKLPGLQTLEEVKSIRGGNAEISILLGKDLVPHDKMFPKG